MKRRFSRWLLVLGATMAVEASAQATSDSVAFRSGQWGNEVAIGSDFNSLGLLRFRSPRAAWLMDLGVSTTRGTGPRFDEPNEGRTTNVELQLGHRWYRPVIPRVYQLTSLGVLGWYKRERGEGALLHDVRSTGGGLFANIGGGWMVTSHLAVGATWEARAVYFRGRQRETLPSDPSAPSQPGTCPVDVETWRSTFFRLGDVSLRATLYY